uniref:Neur_chan_LBD domain-containing protein n=1 Tax=Steinernema glaseri TaxID=37863 RepID=A0A1I7XWC3_9BILA
MIFFLTFLFVAHLLGCGSCNNVTECYKFLSPGGYTSYFGADSEPLAVAACSLPNNFCFTMTDFHGMRYQDCLSRILLQLQLDPTKYDYNDMRCLVGYWYSSWNRLLVTGTVKTFSSEALSWSVISEQWVHVDLPQPHEADLLLLRQKPRERV